MNTVNGQPYFVPSSKGYEFPTFGAPPPPTRYDIIQQEAAIILPSIGVAYRILPKLDVGGRFSPASRSSSRPSRVWGMPGNYAEWVKQDGLFTLDAKDGFVYNWQLGATFHPTPNDRDRGDVHGAEIDIHAKGDAISSTARRQPRRRAGRRSPPYNRQLRRAAGGTAAKLRKAASTSRCR